MSEKEQDSRLKTNGIALALESRFLWHIIVLQWTIFVALVGFVALFFFWGKEVPGYLAFAAMVINAGLILFRYTQRTQGKEAKKEESGDKG